MPSIRAVFFDAGDCLIHLWTHKAERLAWLCRQAGISLPDDPDRIRRGAQTHERFFQDRHQHPDAWTDEWYARMNAAGLEAMGIQGDLLALGARIHQVALSLPPTLFVDPEAEPLLAELRRRGYRLAVVSNWDGSLVDQLRPTGLSGYFDAVLDSDVVGSRKPDTRIFQIACAATGVEPAEALHIGDSPGADVAGALAAGVRPVLLDALDLYAAGFRDLPRFDRIGRLSELLPLLDAATP